MAQKLSKYQQKVLNYFQKKVELANKATDKSEFQAFEELYLDWPEGWAENARQQCIAEIDDRIKLYREKGEGYEDDWQNSKRGEHLLSCHTNIKTLAILEAKGYLKIESMDAGTIDKVTLLKF